MVTTSRVRGSLFIAASLIISLSASGGHQHGTDVSTSHHGAVRSCDDWSVRIDGKNALVSSETIEVAGSTLSADAAKNGGASIRGGSGRGFSVTLCRAAGESLGSSALSQIRLERSGDTISVDGPSGNAWAAHLIITAPAGATLRASATNGPVDASDFDGSLDLDATNGPISLENVRGTISATTTNGPLSLKDGSGEVSLKANNGPVTVRLSSPAWTGQSLEASSVNGPLSFAVPRGFTSGVEIRSAGHAPWHCPESLCGATARMWNDDRDEDKVVRFGGATPIVRLSTENGPISVKERD